MKLFAISDLHLSGGCRKPMDIFGSHWEGHWEKITADWREKVGENDAVAICGDISWAMKYDEFEPDISAIRSLPGKKVMIRGNHDYWHTSLAKTRAMLDGNTFFLQNDCVEIGGAVFAGTRGWQQEDADHFDSSDRKIYDRELGRLRMSLEAAAKKKKPIVVLTHFPPFSRSFSESPFTELVEKYEVSTVLYGHIHGTAALSKEYANVKLNGIRYVLTSCDHLRFSLKEIDIF